MTGGLNFVALAFTPSSIIGPLGTIALVLNLAVAHYWLHEKCTRKDVIGTILVILGAA
jgi:uncharacterized membrane protein